MILVLADVTQNIRPLKFRYLAIFIENQFICSWYCVEVRNTNFENADKVGTAGFTAVICMNKRGPALNKNALCRHSYHKTYQTPSNREFVWEGKFNSWSYRTDIDEIWYCPVSTPI